MAVVSQFHIGTIRRPDCSNIGLGYVEFFHGENIRNFTQQKITEDTYNFAVSLGEIIDVTLRYKDNEGDSIPLLHHDVSISPNTLGVVVSIKDKYSGLINVYYEATNPSIGNYPYKISIRDKHDNSTIDILSGYFVVRDNLNTEKNVLVVESSLNDTYEIEEKDLELSSGVLIINARYPFTEREIDLSSYTVTIETTAPITYTTSGSNIIITYTGNNTGVYPYIIKLTKGDNIYTFLKGNIKNAE